MGAALSGFFQNNCGHFLTPGISDPTRKTVQCLLEELIKMEKQSRINWTTIDTHLSNIPKVS